MFGIRVLDVLRFMFLKLAVKFALKSSAVLCTRTVGHDSKMFTLLTYVQMHFIDLKSNIEVTQEER